jgi:hypothetical protein
MCLQKAIVVGGFDTTLEFNSIVGDDINNNIQSDIIELYKTLIEKYNITVEELITLTYSKKIDDTFKQYYTSTFEPYERYLLNGTSIKDSTTSDTTSKLLYQASVAHYINMQLYQEFPNIVNMSIDEINNDSKINERYDELLLRFMRL